MGFNRPLYLLGVLVLPLLFLLFCYSWKLFSTHNFSIFLYKSLIPVFKQRFFVSIIRLCALTLIFVGLAEPYFYVVSKDSVYHNVRLIFLMDVSRSMVYAEDISPNRLMAAKKEIADLYDSLDGVYPSAIIPFAGAPNVYYCPLTSSKGTFFSVLREVDGSYAPTLGTNLVAAFDSLKSVFTKMEKIDKDGLNLVILLSDGGKEQMKAVDRTKLLGIVGQLESGNFRIYTVGIGKKGRVPLVLRDKEGNFVDYLKVKGKVLYSELDEDILIQVAKKGNGRYVNFDSGSKLSSFLFDVVKENRTLGGKVLEYDKFYYHSFCYAFSAILIWLASLYNRRLLWKIT